MRSLFERPTIAGWSASVQAACEAAEGLKVPPIVAADRETPLPLSYAQERLWFLDQLEPGNAFYNMYSGIRLKGELDIRKLEESFEAIVKRHEILRTQRA